MRQAGVLLNADLRVPAGRDCANVRGPTLAGCGSGRSHAGSFDLCHGGIIEESLAAVQAFLIVDAAEFDPSFAMMGCISSAAHGAELAARADGALCQARGAHDGILGEGVRRVEIPPTLRGGEVRAPAYHGFRFAAPVATILRPVGAERTRGSYSRD